jgi:orotidine-5'-phosphate decarboxylase
MNRNKLVEIIRKRKSMLCVGLDTDPTRIPDFIKENFDDPIFEFNRRIINATKDICVAYKFNIAFYESHGPRGWDALAKSLSIIPDDIFTIADAKRGDIGNTSAQYASTFFELYDFDSITVSPYMGYDSLEPFYGWEDKWVIILGLTSNGGSSDFQMKKLSSGEYLFEYVLKRTAEYGDAGNTMFVIGATQSEYLKRARTIVPDHFFLMPGIGAQGGDLESSLALGMNDDYGLLINSSRGIIYAGNGKTFDNKAAIAAEQINDNIRALINFKS